MSASFESAFVATEIYKTFLHCAAKIIRSEDGKITAYEVDEHAAPRTSAFAPLVERTAEYFSAETLHGVFNSVDSLG